MVIGRDPAAAVHIDAAGVSRLHARILVCGPEISVEDLGSKNGTFVDGHAVTGRQVLCDGNELRVGPVALTLRVPRQDQPTQTMLGL